jgi:hypothetical protein
MRANLEEMHHHIFEQPLHLIEQDHCNLGHQIHDGNISKTDEITQIEYVPGMEELIDNFGKTHKHQDQDSECNSGHDTKMLRHIDDLLHSIAHAVVRHTDSS